MILQVILSLFTINLIENIAFDQHVIADELVYHDDMLILEKVMKTLSVTNELRTSPCQIGHISVSAIKLQPQQWWQSHGCHINTNKRRIWYLVEHVIDENCVSYLRVTANLEPHSILLQANIAIRVPLQQLCINKPHKVTPGLLNHYFL